MISRFFTVHPSSFCAKSSGANALAFSILTRLNTLSIRKLTLSTVKNARWAGRGGFSGNGATQFSFKNAFETARGRSAGLTLRERLLGPTTGKPFIYGTYALIGSSAFGIGMLCYYGLGLSSGTSILDQSRVWPAYVRDRLHTTYGYLAGGLTITAGSGYAVSRTPAMLTLLSQPSLMVMFGSLAAVIATGMLCQSIDYHRSGPLKHVAWLLHCGTLGAVLAPLCMLGGPVLVRAAWYTAGVVAGLSSIAVCAPSERFLNMAGPLAMGLGLVFVANIGTFFLPPGSALGAGLASIVVYGGLVLFSAFLLHDTQRVVRIAEQTPYHQQHQHWDAGWRGFSASEYGPVRSFDPINAQLSIYLDVLNIFIRIAMLLGMSGGGGNKRRH